ncbi:MAG TPA: hypothetical protein DD381_14070 [Lentisphaeria bacterium]|nr:MAG: hypothetical protein A2X47_01195 [Lentisphaerae bacterium GWF2_38_69]HBM17450.1 hypothetical protein [Lentisphaeria bacterium]
MPLNKDKKTRIERSKLILAEGLDAYFFCIWACNTYRPETIQILDFGGIGDLSKFIAGIKLLPNYEQVETIVILRDAEKDAKSAIDSIKSSLKKEGFSIPKKPCEFTSSSPRIAYMVLPGFGKDVDGMNYLPAGTLEDLCIEIVSNDPIIECVDQYLQCVQSKNTKLTHPHKAKLHAYLAGKNEYVGLKIGEASKAGVWNWEHERLKPFKEVIMAM